MYRYPNIEKLLHRRTFLLGAGKGLLFTGILGRLIYLQVYKTDQYKLLANKNRISLRLLTPIRGKILDRNNELLALNKNTFRVLAFAKNKKHAEEILSKVSKIIFLTNSEINNAIQEFSKKKKFMPFLIKDNLKWNEVSAISVNSYNLPQIIIETGLNREYPFSDIGAHIVGYLAPPNTQDIKKDPILGHMNIKIGRSGIEQKFEKKLRGLPGTKHLEVNAFGRVIREIRRENSLSGQDMKLTIDIKFQKFLYSLLKDKVGSLVVIDIQNEELIGIASSPSFDPNSFNQGLTEDKWNEIIKNPLAPLLNKSISGEYSPGPTFKLFVLMSAFKNKIIKKNTLIECTSKLEFGDRFFYCWCHKKKTGCFATRENKRKVGPKLAIAQSCDCFFYELARKIGIEKIAKTARSFGIGEKTEIDLDGEKVGLVPTKSWKRKKYKVGWRIGETLITGVGQGYLKTTPLQLAIATAMIANNGKRIFPKVNTNNYSTNKQLSNEDNTFVDDQEYFSLIKEAMFNAVNKPVGTAYGSRLSTIPFAGKTGTVQVRSITEKEREKEITPNKDLPFDQRDHSLFVGFAPYDTPKYALSVVIEHAGSGSKVAAPIAKKIFKRLI